MTLVWLSSSRISCMDSNCSADWDAYHMNSIDKDYDGNYLVSIRHLNALVKIDKNDGSVIWKMGGKASNFIIGEGAEYVQAFGRSSSRTK